MRPSTTSKDLPPRMMRINRVLKSGKVWTSYYYNGKGDDGKARQIPLGKDLDAAMDAYRTLAMRGVGVDASQSAASIVSRKSDDSMKDVLDALFSQTKRRAKRCGVEFSLELADMATLFDRANGACEVSGIPFSTKRIAGKRFRPWVPSLDREDVGKSYSLENCRLVCAYVNIAMNQFGEKMLVYVARRIARKQFEDETRELI